jgi:hypothetical protein
MVCKTVIRGFDSLLRLSHFQPQIPDRKWIAAFFMAFPEIFKLRQNPPDCAQNGQ